MESATTTKVDASNVLTEKQPVQLEKVSVLKTDGGKTYDIYRHPITKGLGAKQGNNFLGPKFDEFSWNDLIAIAGEENALDFLRGQFRKYCNIITQGAVEEASFQGKDADPSAIAEIFNGFLKDMSARGATKDELEEQQKEMMSELTKLAPQAARNPTLLPKFMEIAARCEKIGKAIEAKARKPRGTAETTTETPAPLAQAA